MTLLYCLDSVRYRIVRDEYSDDDDDDEDVNTKMELPRDTNALFSTDRRGGHKLSLVRIKAVAVATNILGPLGIYNLFCPKLFLSIGLLF